jgi:hypothetical protein
LNNILLIKIFITFAKNIIMVQLSERERLAKDERDRLYEEMKVVTQKSNVIEKQVTKIKPLKVVTQKSNVIEKQVTKIKENKVVLKNVTHKSKGGKRDNSGRKKGENKKRIYFYIPIDRIEGAKQVMKQFLKSYVVNK